MAYAHKVTGGIKMGRRNLDAVGLHVGEKIRANSCRLEASVQFPVCRP